MKEFTKELIKEFDKDAEKIMHRKIKSYKELDDMGSYYHKKWVKLLIECETSKQKEICHSFLAYLIDARKIKVYKLELFAETGNDKIF